MNLVVDETISWASICAAIESTQCDVLESVRLGQIWRDAERLGEGQEKCGCVNPPQELQRNSICRTGQLFC